MDAAHFHLMLNHFPLGGFMLGLFILLIGMWRDQLTVSRVGLGIIIAAALVTAPTFFSGKGAEEIVENIPGVSETLIQTHEEIAEKAVWFVAAAAVVAWIGLATSIIKGTVSRGFLYGVSILVICTMGFLAWTNQLGGEIRHSEIRRDQPQGAWRGSEGD